MLVMLAALLQAALLVPPLQDTGAPPDQDAPTPAAQGQAAPGAEQPSDPDAPAAERAPGTLPSPPAELPAVEPPPPLSAARIEELGRELSKLRAQNPGALKAAEDSVIAFGRGALPTLTKAATSNHPGQMEALVVCLTALADYRDRDLVEDSLQSPLPVLRRFAARKTGEYALPALVDKLPPMLEDKDEAVRLEATLALMANGREDGLAIAAKAFGSPARARVLQRLPSIAGKGAHAMLEGMLRIDPEREKEEAEAAAKERLTAVVLLHAIGDEAAKLLLVKALDDKHNVVQREAINSLRDLLEDQGPLDKSSIFQQINEVKRLKELWQKR